MNPLDIDGNEIKIGSLCIIPNRKCGKEVFRVTGLDYIKATGEPYASLIQVVRLYPTTQFVSQLQVIL